MSNDAPSPAPKPAFHEAWWFRSLLACSLVFAVIAIACLLPSPYGAFAIAGSVLAFIALLYFNPKYRYWRLATSIAAAWIAVRSVPDVTLVALPDWFPLVVTLKGNVPWSFDLAVTFIVSLLSILDRDLRSDFKKTTNWRIRIFSPQTQGANSPGSQNVILGDVSGLNARIEINHHAGHVDFNAKIDQAADHLKNRQPDVAIVKLNELKRESWNRLSDRERYRVEANIGHAYNQKDEWTTAARHFLDARRFQPNDSDAAGLEAIAYYLLGDKPRASELAEQVLSDDPRNENALVAKIRSAEESTPTEGLEKHVPAELANDPQILFALCCSASIRRELEAAVEYSRRFHAVLPDDSQAKMTLGCALANLAIDGYVGRREIDRATCESLASEAHVLLTEVLGLDGQSRLTRSHAYYHRGLAQEVLGKPDKAEGDLRAATAERPSDGELNYQLCVFLVRHDKYGDAIEHFDETQCSNSAVDPGLMLARLLFSRGNPDDHDRAEKLLLGILDADPPPDERLAFEGLELLARELAKSGYEMRAAELISEYSHRLDSAGRFAIEAEIALTVENTEDARNAAVKSHAAITEATPTVTLYFLGKTLADVSEDERATEVLKRVVDAASSDYAGELLLQTAWRSKDFGFVIDFTAKLRELGRATSQSRELEIAALETVNEYGEALARIDEYLHSPNDEGFARYLRLKKSWIGKRLEDDSLITYEASQLPSLEDCGGSKHLSLSVVCGVAQLLSEGPNPSQGYHLAYETVRQNFDLPLAHQCLMSVCGLGAQRPTEQKSVVDNESAVAISDSKTGEIRWRVFEKEDPSGTRDEIGPESHLGQQLIGKTVGDKVQLSRDSLQDRFGIIEEIFDKVSYRVMDSTRNWSRRFEENDFLRQFDFSKPNGELDVDAFFEVQRKLNEPMELAISMYLHQLPSIGFLARVTRRSILQTVGYLANTRETHIQCCNGNVEERTKAEKLIASHMRIVLDPTSLATLFHLKAHAKLVDLPAEVYVTAGALDTIRSLRRNPHSCLYSKHYVGFRHGQPCYEERTDEEVANGVSELTEFIDWIENKATVVGGRGVLTIPTENREKWREIFGTAMVESLGVAHAENAVLCTDDPAIAVVASEVLTFDRLWTSLFLEHLTVTSNLDMDVYRELLILLVANDYRFIPVDQEMIDQVGSRSGWEAKDREFDALVNWLHLSGVASPVPAAAYMIGRTWDETKLAHLRTDVLSSVVRSLGKRSDALKCLRQLHATLRSFFKLRPDALGQCHQAIRREEARELAVCPLILPGDPDFSIPRYACR